VQILAVALPGMCSEWTDPEFQLLRISETIHARFAQITSMVKPTNANPRRQPYPIPPGACALKFELRMCTTSVRASANPAALYLKGGVRLYTTLPAPPPARTC
jgi:hypothetical protein